MRLRAEVYTKEQLSEALGDPRIELIYTPISFLSDSLLPEAERLAAVPPVFLGDCEAAVGRRLGELREMGFPKALAHTVGHIELLQKIGFEIYGGVRLNCLNSETLSFLAGCGVRDAVVSAELTARQMSTLKKPFPIGFLAYGFLPLMITRRCPIRDGKPCGTTCCGQSITDRKGRKMNVICSENTAEILNSDALDLGDRLDAFQNADFAVLKFTVEKKIAPILSAYAEGLRTGSEPFTRGLYFRGLENDKNETERM